MKMSKRIFVCLIALAIGVSMFALGASAADGELKYTTENHARILEYYEEPVIFGMDFENDELDKYSHDQLVNTLKRNTTVVAEGNGGKYLSITGGSATPKSNPVYLNWNAAEDAKIDDFILEFDLMTKGSGARTVNIYVGESAAEATDINKSSGVPGILVAKINFKDGKLEYINGIDGETYTYGTVEADLASETFYRFTLNYGVASGNVSMNVSLDGQSVASYTDGIVPLNVIGNVRFGSSIDNIKNSTLAFDNIVASGGSFARRAEDKIPETERAIADFIAICQNPDVAVDDKVAVVNTGMRLISVHGVVGETEEAKANVLTFKKLGVNLFVDQLVNCVNGINPEAPYAELVEYVTAYKKYVDLIPEDVSFMDDVAAIKTAVSNYNKAYETLETYKNDSEAVLTALADIELTNTNVRSYAYLKGYYDLIVNCTPYIGYPGVAEIMDSYNTVIAKYEALAAVGAAFTENVGVAANTENGFGVRYAAYVIARNNYFDDLAYPEIAETLSTYAVVDEEMTAIISLCDEFILNVNRADYSQYLSAKQNALTAAALSLPEITESYLEYPGVPEAIERYEVLVSTVGQSIADAQAYVSYVNNLAANAENMTKEELKDAIDEALALQEKGNVIGVDGVTEANIALNNMQSTLELAVGYKTQFNGLVNNLVAEKNNANKFAIIADAIEAAANAERYEGVDSADKAKLDAAIAEYNAKIQALNNGFATANDVACNTVSASSGSSSDDTNVGKVVALIKKFYE